MVSNWTSNDIIYLALCLNYRQMLDDGSLLTPGELGLERTLERANPKQANIRH